MSQYLFVPKLWTCLREGYSREQLAKDFLAGIIVGIVALPLAIAFGIASGVKPEQGLYTAIVAGFLISALSGSRVQIGGPTGAFIVIVFDIVQKFGYDGLAIATYGWRSADRYGVGAARISHQIHSLPGHRRLYQRHCTDHLNQPDTRPARLANGAGAVRIYRQTCGLR